MTSGHEKSHLIRKRLSSVYEVYSDLLKDQNKVIFKSMVKSLNMLFNEINILTIHHSARSYILDIINKKCRAKYRPTLNVV